MKKTLLLITGHLFLMLGLIGAVLPILPTTPFLLLAVFCYSRSNHRLHNWLVNHKYLGPPLRDWEKSGAISLKAKIIATVMLSLLLAFRLPTLKIKLAIKIIASAIVIGVLVFIWTRPTPPKELQ